MTEMTCPVCKKTIKNKKVIGFVSWKKEGSRLFLGCLRKDMVRKKKAFGACLAEMNFI